ncbi:MAG: tRNA (adenosine(37)-N6)-threonylcarbamoyltransferase complex dimerization subunit type 1 TsaB, partial [Gemmatimonadaceae bacterium]
KGADEERLMPAVAAVLESAGASVTELGRVVCGAGPGSFTSLRIAGAIAKGIATGVGCPLYAVPSMALIVGGADLGEGRYLVAIDALRHESYVGLFDVEADGELMETERARLVATSSLDAVAEEYGAQLVSPSPLPGAIHARPHARAIAHFERSLVERGEVDVASWEPAYGRLAEAQVRWETAHGRPLPTG